MREKIYRLTPALLRSRGIGCYEGVAEWAAKNPRGVPMDRRWVFRHIRMYGMVYISQMLTTRAWREANVQVDQACTEFAIFDLTAGADTRSLLLRRAYAQAVWFALQTVPDALRKPIPKRRRA